MSIEDLQKELAEYKQLFENAKCRIGDFEDIICNGAKCIETFCDDDAEEDEDYKTIDGNYYCLECAKLQKVEEVVEEETELVCDYCGENDTPVTLQNGEYGCEKCLTWEDAEYHNCKGCNRCIERWLDCEDCGEPALEPREDSDDESEENICGECETTISSGRCGGCNPTGECEKCGEQGEHSTVNGICLLCRKTTTTEVAEPKINKYELSKDTTDKFDAFLLSRSPTKEVVDEVVEEVVEEVIVFDYECWACNNGCDTKYIINKCIFCIECIAEKDFFGKCKVADLKSMCKTRGLSGYSKLKKQELIDLLRPQPQGECGECNKPLYISSNGDMNYSHCEGCDKNFCSSCSDFSNCDECDEEVCGGCYEKNHKEHNVEEEKCCDCEEEIKKNTGIECERCECDCCEECYRTDETSGMKFCEGCYDKLY